MVGLSETSYFCPINYCHPHLPATPTAMPNCDSSPAISSLYTLLTPYSPRTLLSLRFDGIIRPMDGEQFHIHLSSNAKPFCVTSPRSVPCTHCDN